MNIPCANAAECAPDNLALTGYEADTPDVAAFLSTQFAAVVPPVGFSTWQRFVCQATAQNINSLSAAQLQAYAQALACAMGNISPFAPETGQGGLPGVFFNSPQECTVTCPVDGLPFTFIVPVGTFIGSSQAAADEAALSYACQQANQRAICLSQISPSLIAISTGTPSVSVITEGQSWNLTITATGNSLSNQSGKNSWQITAGGIPPGMTFTGGVSNPLQGTISGIPTSLGTYPFTLTVTDPLGDVMTKNFIIYVVCQISSRVIVDNTLDCNSNLQSIVFQPIPNPAPPYDTAWQVTDPGGTPACPNNCTLITNFKSNPGDVWNWKLFVFAGQHVTLVINGVTVVNAGPFIGGQTFTGSFNGPSTCGGAIQTNLQYLSEQASGNSCLFEWQTPPYQP